jgi:hypothetical protein
VSLIYRDSSVGNRIHIAVVKLLRLKVTQPSWDSRENYLKNLDFFGMQETESFTDPKAERTSASDILKANTLRTLMIECVEKATFTVCFLVNISAFAI